MATAPLMDFGFPHPPAHENGDDRIAELVRLQKFAQRITSTLDIEELIPRIVDEVASSLGCVEINLYLHDRQQSEFVLAGVRGCSVHGKGHRLKAGAGMVGHVAATGKMHYAPDVTLDPYYMSCEPDTRSEVAIPLRREGDLVGVFTASHCELNAFCPDQLRLLQGLCAHISVAVHNARRFGDEREQRERMSREAEEARSIQQALLPRSSPLIPGFSVTGLSIPAGSVGGDWYDFIALGEGRWGLVLADVSGKGMAAALLMSATRGMLRSLAQTGAGPADVQHENRFDLAESLNPSEGGRAEQFPLRNDVAARHRQRSGGELQAAHKRPAIPGRRGAGKLFVPNADPGKIGAMEEIPHRQIELGIGGREPCQVGRRLEKLRRKAGGATAPWRKLHVLIAAIQANSASRFAVRIMNLLGSKTHVVQHRANDSTDHCYIPQPLERTLP